MRVHLHREEPVMVSPDPGLSFPSSPVKTVPNSRGRINLCAPTPGLYGVEGHLPAAWREAAQGDSQEARALRGFLDIPGRRQAHLNYRVWQRSRPTLIDGQGSHPLQACLAALGGQGFQDRAGIDPLMGGITAQPSADALAARISRWLGQRYPDIHHPVRIAQFQPHWVSLFPTTGLGRSPGNRLGMDTHLGERVPDRSGPIHIVIGPLSIDQVRALSPGQHVGQALAAHIRRGLGRHHDFVLSLEHVPRRLPQLGCQGPVLGMDILPTQGDLPYPSRAAGRIAPSQPQPMKSMPMTPMTPMTQRPRLQLDLQCQGGERLTVLDFSSQDLALSRSYRLDVRCHSHSPLVASEVLGQAACLRLDRGSAAPCIHGLVTALDQSPGAAGKGVIQHICLESPLAPLARTRQNRVFPGMGVRAVVEEVLQGHGWTPAQWRMACRDDDPVEDLIVQVEEDDLAFITRLMAFHGLFYRFEQSRQGVTLVIHDDACDLPEAPVRRLPFHAHSGQHAPADIIYRLAARARLMPGAVQLRDHFPDHPQVALHARQECKQLSGGLEDHWGAGFATPGQGEHLARVRAESLDTQSLSFSAWTGHRALTPGQRITLTGHPHADFNKTYTITALQLRGEQASSLPDGMPTTGPAFSTRLELIPSTQSYRPPLTPHRSSARFVARIDGPEGEPIHLDAHGRYRIRFDFDSREHPPGQASHPVRMLTPYAGDDFGFHFPLHAGTEVLVAFENNDPHRPIILGALPNADHPSPVTAHNRHQNLLRTHGGNELLMNDQPHGPGIRLSTRDHGLRVLMDATPEDPHLALHADDGRMLWQAGQSLSLQTGGDQIVEVGGDQRVNVQGASSLETREGSLQLISGEDLRVQAGGDLHLEAGQGDLEQRSQGSMNLRAGRGMRLEVRQGDLECHVANGRLGMSAGGRITLQSQSGEIHIGHAHAGIRLTPRGELVIQGREVRIEAETIRVQGDGIVHNGG
ncbi:hypothetical protein ECTOBSL9_1060 [Ectothiorhodospira sp. BSL-9]|nr:hypothetical protein ECTOBSL9_1060 [Ectothiorhodospira sp. BSL-9]